MTKKTLNFPLYIHNTLSQSFERESQTWLLTTKMEIMAFNFKHTALFDYTIFIIKKDIFEFRIE